LGDVGVGPPCNVEMSGTEARFSDFF
jgi:hypothetical protein